MDIAARECSLASKSKTLYDSFRHESRDEYAQTVVLDSDDSAASDANMLADKIDSSSSYSSCVDRGFLNTKNRRRKRRQSRQGNSSAIPHDNDFIDSKNNDGFNLYRYDIQNEISRQPKQRRRRRQSYWTVSHLARLIHSSISCFMERSSRWRQNLAYMLLADDQSETTTGIFRSFGAMNGSKGDEKRNSAFFASRLSDVWSRESMSKEAFYRPNGIHWITAALFIVADMAGGGVVAMPIAMLKSGGIIGCTVIAIVGSAFCYTAHLLGKNWLLMCRRWPTVYGGSSSYLVDTTSDDKSSRSSDADFAHCRKPYPEMALRSMGRQAQTLTSYCLNVMLYGVSIVYLLLASKIISDFVASAFQIQVGQCSMLLIVSIALLPVTFLKSPQDFWWAVVTAMVTTAVAVVLILVGTIMDAPLCAPQAHHPDFFRSEEFLLSLGIFMFAFGGHGVFPTIQHDMKRPQQFTSSAVLAFAIVFFMYIPITLLGYAVYGDSLQESIINSIQIPGIQVAANLCIAIHCILTLTIVINPLNQQFEHILRSPHHFGWRRVFIRTGVMALIVFSAETIPSFGPILNLIGGSLVALTSAVLPCLFNLFMGARYGSHNVDKSSEQKEPPVPTITEVIQKTPLTTLSLNLFIIAFAVICGVTTTWSALLDLASSTFSVPCYLSGSSLFGGDQVQPMLCCGAARNVHRMLLSSNASDFCSVSA